MSFEMSRDQYASLYGPTAGDAIRLADTELFARVEKDLTTPGEEAVFGGGKVVRDGMGQNGQLVRDVGIPDLVITNVVVIDWTGARSSRRAGSTRTSTSSARTRSRPHWSPGSPR